MIVLSQSCNNLEYHGKMDWLNYVSRENGWSYYLACLFGISDEKIMVHFYEIKQWIYSLCKFLNISMSDKSLSVITVTNTQPDQSIMLKFELDPSPHIRRSIMFGQTPHKALLHLWTHLDQPLPDHPYRDGYVEPDLEN